MISKLKSIFGIWVAYIYIFVINISHADLLTKITSDAQTSDTPYVDLWSDYVTVGRNVFGFGGRDSIIASVTTVLLQLTVAVSVSMILYSWIRYILSMWDSKKEQAVRQKLINTLIGVVIAMSSVAIIYLAGSVIEDVINISKTS